MPVSSNIHLILLQGRISMSALDCVEFYNTVHGVQVSLKPWLDYESGQNKKKKLHMHFLMLMILLVPEMVMGKPQMIENSFIAH